MRVHLGNVYVGNRTLLKTLRRLFRKRPDAIVINEGRFVIKVGRPLIKAMGYRTYVSPYGDRRGRTDVIVLVHKRNEHLGFVAVRISKALKKYPNAHERYAVAALMRNKQIGRVAVVGIHPTPAPKLLAGTNSRHPLVREYSSAMNVTSGLVDWLESDGYKVVLAGDVQIRQDAEFRGWSPYALFDRHKMPVAISEGIDVIAASNRLDTREAGVLAQSGRLGSDHPLLYATFDRARPK